MRVAMVVGVEDWRVGSRVLSEFQSSSKYVSQCGCVMGTGGIA